MATVSDVQAILHGGEVHEVRKRVLGAEHPHTLTVAGNLSRSLSGQGKYADADRIERQLLEVQKRVLGAEHPSTLTSAANLAYVPQKARQVRRR